MFKQVYQWYKTRFADPDLSALFLLLMFSFATIYFFGSILTPVFVAIVLAYLLDWPVTHLMRLKLNRTICNVNHYEHFYFYFHGSLFRPITDCI